ncbi:CO or xanthine dehydrogenase, FAD-binding subunit [Streptomyces zhaozhouensis]|uniref:CO or xanthine dehydrogenase, FAD-binding subunit n=1 Tax=Streptomyces zhaozhouensis TaxID=1300267 RepID=A0A286DZ23_9ACTN|nr:xanthine dehydrogenase family protein subunit M [Streptomyces zhaozhouensis]SOD63919.1 CO or xanthine dehydrogenase, FAD-binding subunit [Streptomyces zhaozhouensis]
MEFLRPATWREALAVKAAHPEAVPLAGGTDLMVEINFDRRRPERLLDLSRLTELRDWHRESDTVRIGAGVPFHTVIDRLAAELPALAMAARTVGSPQIRNRATLAGNLGTASPAGDAHPALLVAGADVEVASARGTRTVPVEEFFLGPKRNALAPDELIRSVAVRTATGPQQFAKVGTRNAMVIAVCAVALALHPDTRTVRAAIGSAAPTPLRAREAEKFLNGVLAEGDHWATGRPPPPAAATRFAALVAAACAPVDDVRGSADYRRHAVRVLARRTLDRAWRARTSTEGAPA